MFTCQICGFGFATSSCPRCASYKNIEKQTKLQAKQFKLQQKMMAGSGANNSASGSAKAAEFLTYMMILPLKLLFLIMQQLVNAYGKMFGALSSEFRAVRSGEKSKAEGYTRIAFIAGGIIVLTFVVVGLLMHNKK